MARNEHINYSNQAEYDEIDGVTIADVEEGDFIAISTNLYGVVLTGPKVRPGATSTGKDAITVQHNDAVFIGESSDAFTVGQNVYLAAAARYGKSLTNDADGGSNFKVGTAHYKKGAGAGQVFVRVAN